MIVEEDHRIMNFRRGICLSLIGAGLLVSGYMLARTFMLLADTYPEGWDVCSVAFGASCDSTLLGLDSWWLGIPLAGWGIVFYLTLASLLILTWSLGTGFEEATQGAVVLSLVGACMSLVLAVMMFAKQVPFCPLCLFIHVVNLALVPALIALSERSVFQLAQSLIAGVRYVVGGKTDNPREAVWKVVGFVTAGLVAVTSYQWVYVESTLRKTASNKPASPTHVIAEFTRTPTVEIPVTPNDPLFGASDAPVQLVVFSSFQCPAFQLFARELPNLAERFPGRVAIRFIHFPLSTDCNSRMKVNKQPNACEAACAGEAAHLQQQFWPFHDKLFSTDLMADEDAIRNISEELGLDINQFESDRQNVAVRDKVKADIQLGIDLNIDATPAVYLNNRRVRNFTPRALDILVRYVLIEQDYNNSNEN
jgi:protein-disulfide isomerase